MLRAHAVATWPSPKCCRSSMREETQKFLVRLQVLLDHSRPIGKYSCMMILIDIMRAKSSGVRADVCIFDSQASLAHSFHRYRLPPIIESIFPYPTEDLHSQFTFFTSYYSRNDACIRYRASRYNYWFLSRHCHLSNFSLADPSILITCHLLLAAAINAGATTVFATCYAPRCRSLVKKKLIQNAYVVSSPFPGWFGMRIIISRYRLHTSQDMLEFIDARIIVIKELASREHR